MTAIGLLAMFSPDDTELLIKIQRLSADERKIIGELINRMDAGRRVYGPWRLADGRDLPAEALEEVLDALHYCAAALVRLGADKGDTT
jgi:hypothetical protein